MSRSSWCKYYKGISFNSGRGYNEKRKIYGYVQFSFFFFFLLLHKNYKTLNKIFFVIVHLVSTESRPPKMKLECLAQYTLHGNVMSMQAVHLIGSQRDSLLLSFRDAKLSVVEYDQEVHDLRTVSLHYFEEEEIRVIQ